MRERWGFRAFGHGQRKCCCWLLVVRLPTHAATTQPKNQQPTTNNQQLRASRVTTNNCAPRATGDQRLNHNHNHNHIILNNNNNPFNRCLNNRRAMVHWASPRRVTLIMSKICACTLGIMAH